MRRWWKSVGEKIENLSAMGLEKLGKQPATGKKQKKGKSVANGHAGLGQLIEVSGSMKTAFYNVTVMTMAVCFVLGVFAAYFLFYEFVKPMIWALVTGIVLFPLKRKLVRVARGWLNYLCQANTPLTVGVVTLPWNLTLELGDFLLDLAANNLKAVLLIGASFPVCSLILYYETIPKFLVMMKKVAQRIDTFICIFRGFWVPSLFVGYYVYIIVLKFFGATTTITTQSISPQPESGSVENSNPNLNTNVLKSKAVSWALWTAMLAYACGYFGPLGTPVFAAVLCLCSTYYFMPDLGIVPLPRQMRGSIRRYLRRSQNLGATSDTEEDEREAVKKQLIEPDKEISASQQHASIDSQADKSAQDGGPVTENGYRRLSVQKQEETADDIETNLYLRYLFMACFFVWISLHLWMMFILLVPIGLALLKRLVRAFDIVSTIKSHVGNLSNKFDGDLEIIVPSPLRHLFKVLIHVDRQIIYWLRESMDLVGSFAAMILLVITLAGLSGFILFQLYYESLHLIQLVANIANQTLTNNVAFQTWLHESVNVTSVTELTDQAVKRAYGIGRNWLTSQVHEIITNDEEKARMLESQIVTTLDNFFNSWIAKNFTAVVNQTQTKSAIAQWNDVWTVMDGKNDWNLLDQIQEYLTVAWSLADSAWVLLKSNIEVLLVGLSQMLSTVVASGTAVVDFFLDSIVFFTFLVFLLSSSDDEYKPMKLIRELVPSGRAAAVHLTEEIEAAVSSVFLATFKMTIFYGMFTWLTHTLFAVNIVFIPSVLAAVFAAIPFFGTYIVAVPAILELWLIRGEPFLAILLFLLHYFPAYLVDDAIYSEIRLTTPFVTGMAITGGMLWWGLEGAIFGPLVLCCLLVTGSMYLDVIYQTVTNSNSANN